MWLQAQAHLNPQQKQHIMELRRVFLTELQAIISQRRLIISTLHACVPDCHDGTHGGATTAKVLLVLLLDCFLLPGTLVAGHMSAACQQA